MTLTLDLQGQIFKPLYRRNGKADWHWRPFIIMPVTFWWPRWSVRIYRIANRVTSDVGVQLTRLVKKKQEVCFTSNSSSHRKVFYFNILSLMQPGYLPVTSTILCVEKCPTLAINTVSDLTTYATNKSVQLCRYDILPASYSNGSNPSDTCPSLPLMAQ